MAVIEAAERPARERTPPQVDGTAPSAPGGRAILAPVAAGLAATVAALVVFRAALVNGDTIYHLVWGRELAAGELSTFATGPTPHPLPLLAGALTSLLGDGASYVVTYVLFGPASLGLLVAACVMAARQLGGTWWAAGLVVLILATSTPVLANVATARYDVLFAALVVLAVAVEARRPRSAVAPLVLLVVSGLLRPEGWVLAGVYALYRWSGLRIRQRAAYAVAVAFAPAAWIVMDLLVMGDPFHSWNVTEAGSDTYYRQFTPGENLEEAGRNLVQYVGVVPLLLAGLGAGFAVRRRDRRRLVALAALALPLIVFLALLARGTASSDRYLLLPACLAALLAALVAGSRPRTPLAVMGVTVASVLVVYGLGARLDNPGRVGTDAREAAARNAAMRDLAGYPGVATATRDCRLAGVPTGRMIPLAALHAHRSPATWRVDDRGVTRPQVYFVPASEEAREILTRRRFDDDDSFVLPSGLVAGPRTAHWRAYGDPEAACAAGLWPAG